METALFTLFTSFTITTLICVLIGAGIKWIVNQFH